MCSESDSGYLIAIHINHYRLLAGWIEGRGGDDEGRGGDRNSDGGIGVPGEVR